MFVGVPCSWFVRLRGFQQLFKDVDLYLCSVAALDPNRGLFSVSPRLFQREPLIFLSMRYLTS